MAFIPPRPVGEDEEALGLQALWDMLFDPRRSIFRDTPTLKFGKQADGTYVPFLKVNPAGGNQGWFWPAGGEVYDETKTYSRQQVVFVPPAHALVTTGIDNDGTTVFAVAGLWVCTQATDGTTATMPTWPLPDATDPGNAANYWWLISPSQVCT